METAKETTQMSQILNQQAGSNESKKQDMRVVNHLVKRLRGIFPAWRASIKTQEELDDTRREWLYALVAAGISTIEQIDDGIKFAQQYNSAFWPSCGMFIEWCNEGTIERLGVPDSHDCKNKLIAYSNDSKVKLDRYSYWIWRKLDSHKFKTAPARDSDKHFAYHYKRMVKAVLAAEHFPEQPKPIAPKAEPQIAPEEAAKNMKSALAELNLGGSS